MRGTAAREFVPFTLAVGMLALFSGCMAVDVEMTSTPDTVHAGQPVTFDLKLTNRSQCPLPVTLAEIIAFIPADHFIDEIFGGLTSGAPPEVVDFLNELETFFDELCSGGEPEFPTPPIFPCPASCDRGENEIVCQMSTALPSHEGNSGSMTVAGLGNRLQCEIDAGAITCRLRFPLPSAGAAAAAKGSGAALPPELTCLTTGDFGDADLVGNAGAICFLGTFPDLGAGLGPNGMATGQVSIPARGSGFVRNIVIAVGNTSGSDEDLGVCKGGSNDGGGCSQADTDPCPGGGTCGEGICQMGANPGRGCDTATEAADCGIGGSCVVCSELAHNGFLPIDCTTTYISPEGVPAMSSWGLIGLAVLLLGVGTLWLQRRTRRA